MIRIGLIKEGKIPSDNRVALTPEQCKRISSEFPEVQILVQSSENRCYSDEEYRKAGFIPSDDISTADILLGIKEVPVEMLIPDKTYFFFSHTVKKQPYNRYLFRKILEKKITLIDFELLTHSNGSRILGFGYFAGIVGAHNGLYAYGKRTGSIELKRAFSFTSMQDLFNSYKKIKLPDIKIAVTGSGRVSQGILKIMDELNIKQVSPDDFKKINYNYPVYTHLKGGDLYVHKSQGNYNRNHFHGHPEEYICLFPSYTAHTDILMNGIFWNEKIPRLFDWEDIRKEEFKLNTIADITDDKFGSVPCNLGDATIDDPVYGVNKISGEKTAPYLKNSIDIMAVGNLPNELPRDASENFGEEFISYILPRLLSKAKDDILERATMVKNGIITPAYAFLENYGKPDGM